MLTRATTCVRLWDTEGRYQRMQEENYMLISNAITELSKVIMVIINDSLCLKFIAKALRT